MRKLIFIIAVCMLYHNAYGAVGQPCGSDDVCLKGTIPIPYSYDCGVCPANTYMDEELCPDAKLFECKPCPAGTITIGDTAADHDSIDDCVAAPVLCASGYYLPAGSATCTQCPKNSYCPGGEYTQSGQDSGIIACPNDTKSPIGSDSADDCGRILHIGEYILYLRTAKLTTPSLNVQIGNTVYYGDMFPA